MNGSSPLLNMVAVFSVDDLVSVTNTAGVIMGGPAGAALEAVGELTAAQLRAIMPAARAANVSKYLGPINTAFKRYGISSLEQRAAILGQISVECGQLNGVVENLNYSAKRLRVVFPRRFKTMEAAKPYAHNPEKLANHVYGNRMRDLGNGDETSGDGYKYRGRGLLQITGRANYRAAGFENNPEALEDPNTAASSAARHWQEKGLNGRTRQVLTRAQYNGVTHAVNGGTNGSNERWAAYLLALRVLLQKPSLARRH